ncbi:MAG: hypothetical protein HGA76_02225 [Candidatus Firestonebacteria bacterium]|nr:hypothetical protein [Candidatus Firestonebacteria bacterium]
MERQWGVAKTLEAYLTWRQGQLTLAEVQPKREQQLWERQIQAWLAAVAALR